MAEERLQRRRFLKGLGAVAATATVGEQIALSSSAYADPSEEKNKASENKDLPKKKGAPDENLRIFADIGWDAQAQILAQSQHWGIVWARAIALSWHDSTFRQQLLANAKVAIRDRLNYKVNPELKLTVLPDPNHAQYKGPGVPVDDGNGNMVIRDTWPDLPKNELILYLPDPPTNKSHWAIAVAEYADTGRTYPFTSL